jgi:hypothetical protein
MQIPVSGFIGHFSHDETYQFFLFENSVEVLDEMLAYFISIENYNACSAIGRLFREKGARN